MQNQKKPARSNLLNGANKIPNLRPDSSQLLMELMENNRGTREVLTKVKLFAGLVAKLIFLANSAWSNPRTEVTTLDAACTRLGLDVVRTVAVGMLVGQAFNILKCPGFDRIRYWASSIIASQSAAQLAPKFELEAPSALAAGLLQNVGLLWLADQFPEETNNAISLTENVGGTGLNKNLETTCGIGYRAAGLVLLTDWQLPDILLAGLVCPEGAIDAPEQLSRMNRLISVSAHIASTVCAGGQKFEWASAAEKTVAIGVFDEQRAKLPQTLELAETLFN